MISIRAAARRMAQWRWGKPIVVQFRWMKLRGIFNFTRSPFLLLFAPMMALWLLVSILLRGSPAPTEDTGATTQFSKSNAEAIIPLINSDGKMYAKVIVNNSVTGLMPVDTGSSIITISHDVAPKLSLK